MNTSTATTTRPSENMFPDGPVPTADQPCYAYVGDGRWLPCNQSAIDECAAWNTFADRWNARTAATRSLHHGH